jgi:membrane-associated phospholipid phosphatase
MDETTNPQGVATPTVPTKTGGANLPATQRPRPVEIILFVLGVMILAAASVLVRFHPRPYIIDLQTTETIQSLQLHPWINAFIEFVSSLNNPIPSIIALAVWLVGLVVLGLIARVRGRSGFKWFQSAGALILTVAIAGGINFIINMLVARPRPGSFGEHIRVLSHIPVNSFPSGHTEHDVAYYGFLLYLSFTPPVNQWRYRWILIPFQIFAVVDILTIGFSRILEGEHWLTDVLAGYLSGALWLLMCIVIYRWISSYIALRSQQQGAASN